MNRTKEEIISTMRTNEANLKYIAETGTINGSLYQEIQRAMEEYAKECIPKWISVLERQPINKKAVWAFCKTLGGKLLIPCVAYYSNGSDIEVFDVDENSSYLKAGWYTLESQLEGCFEEVYVECNIEKWLSITPTE